jgi:hypothetical protein
MRRHALDEDKHKQNGTVFIWCHFDFNFGRAQFIVSPARQGEAQDMSGI